MRYIPLALALGFLALVAPAGAQQHQAYLHWTPKFLKVGRCDAHLNEATTYPAYVGYRPGFYPPGRPWYWRDPYGRGFYQPPYTTSSPTMYVDFTNTTQLVMTSIVWGLVANGHLVAEAKDVGTFTPGVEIRKKYAISENAFPLQTASPQCVALAITFENGKHLVNPSLPPERRQMYMSPPHGAGPPASPLP